MVHFNDVKTYFDNWIWEASWRWCCDSLIGSIMPEVLLFLLTGIRTSFLSSMSRFCHCFLPQVDDVKQSVTDENVIFTSQTIETYLEPLSVAVIVLLFPLAGHCGIHYLEKAGGWQLWDLPKLYIQSLKNSFYFLFPLSLGNILEFVVKLYCYSSILDK